MFRKALALGLFVSLLLSGIFFSPVNTAEEDEEYYEDQPYLYYDLHLHELDYTFMKRIFITMYDKNYSSSVEMFVTITFFL